MLWQFLKEPFTLFIKLTDQTVILQLVTTQTHSLDKYQITHHLIHLYKTGTVTGQTNRPILVFDQTWRLF